MLSNNRDIWLPWIVSPDFFCIVGGVHLCPIDLEYLMNKCPTLSGQCLAVSFVCILLVQFEQYTVSNWTKGTFSLQMASFALNKVNSTSNFLSAFHWEFWESGSDHQTLLATLPTEPSHPTHNCSLEGAFPFLAMLVEATGVGGHSRV